MKRRAAVSSEKWSGARRRRGGEREAVVRESLSGESDGAERVEREFRERNNGSKDTSQRYGNSQLFFFFINVYLISYVHVFI